MRAAPASRAALARARASGACSTSAVTYSVCPGWTFAPTRTTRDAYRSRRSTVRMIEASISRVERHVVPARTLAAEPGERVLALGGDRMRLGLLLPAQVAVDLAEGAEVAAQRRRQQALLEAAHRRRRDQLVEAGELRRQLDRP